MALWTWRLTTSAACSIAPYLHEGCLMDSLDPASPAAATIDVATRPTPRVWKFWGTTLWGFVVFAAMFAGQLAVVGWFLLRQGGPLDQESFGDAVRIVVSNGLTISLSVITGLPAVAAALWIAIRIKHARFADYLALRSFSWANLAIGVVALFVLVMGWDAVSRATGREVEPGFMGDVLKTAQDDGALWLLVFAFCVAAPITEEFFARGFLYRGWSESFLRVPGAIVLSSLVWTGLHLQYNWYFLGEVFSIGLLLGYLRYRSNSTWLTIILHGLNNLAAVVQTILLTSS
jgi:membrane protease YdiL (CAAX protease family)